MMPINVWDYLREYDELRDEVLATVDRVFRSGRLVRLHAFRVTTAPCWS